MSANIPANTDGGLITADNCAVVFIDHQPQMTFGVANIDRHLLMNNVVLLAKCAKLYGVPTVLTQWRPKVSAATFGPSCSMSSQARKSSSGLR